MDGVRKRRVDEYKVVVGDIEFEKRRFENTDFVVTNSNGIGRHKNDEPSWFEVSIHPIGMRPSIAYAGPIDVYQKRQGVLAVIIENTRLAQFLSQLSVGKNRARRSFCVATAPSSPPRIPMPTRPTCNARISLAADRAKCDQAGGHVGRRQTKADGGYGSSPMAMPMR